MKNLSKHIFKVYVVLFIVFLLVTVFTVPALPEDKKPSESVIPKANQTVLGLYLKSKEAYGLWQKNPEKVKIIDCRSPEEYVFVGHPVMAHNIPVKFMTYRWDATKKNYFMEDNPDFVAQVQKICQPTDTVLIICRFGNRTAIAVNKLAAAGFKNAYSIVDGFEGELIKGSGTYMTGQSTHYGWKHSGAPWTYDLNPELIYAVSPQ